MPRAPFPSGCKPLVLLVLAAAIIGAWWWQRPPPEPTHDGERLSKLLTDYGKLGGFVRLSTEQIRAFGPAALPWLTYTVEHGKHPFKKQSPLPFDRAPDWLRRMLPEKWGGLRASSPVDERIQAAVALQALGPDAAPAIPALARVLESECENDNSLPTEVASALHAIGPASWPAVQQTLQHGRPSARWALLVMMPVRLGSARMSASETEVANVAAALRKACADPNENVRRGAIWGIANCSSARSDLAGIDSLTGDFVQLLSSSEIKTRKAAAETLAYGTAKAAVAIPRLIELLDDPDDILRMHAAMALGNLDTEKKISAARLREMLRHDASNGCRQAARDALKTLQLSPNENTSGANVLPAQ